MVLPFHTRNLSMNVSVHHGSTLRTLTAVCAGLCGYLLGCDGDPLPQTDLRENLRYAANLLVRLD